MQYAMLLLSRSTEGGGKGEESYKYKLSCYAIADIVYNEADDEGENEGVGLSSMNVHIAAQSYLRRGAHSLHLSISKGI